MHPARGRGWCSYERAWIAGGRGGGVRRHPARGLHRGRCARRHDDKLIKALQQQVKSDARQADTLAAEQKRITAAAQGAKVQRQRRGVGADRRRRLCSSICARTAKLRQGRVPRMRARAKSSSRSNRDRQVARSPGDRPQLRRRPGRAARPKQRIRHHAAPGHSDPLPLPARRSPAPPVRAHRNHARADRRHFVVLRPVPPLAR